MKSAMIYGASGFIGKHLVKGLSKLGIDVISVVPEDTDEFIVDELDKYSTHIIICSLNKVATELANKVCQNIDITYFLAWDGLSKDGLNDYQRQINNVTYMLNLMKESVKLGARKFIGSGSITQQELYREEGRTYLTDKHKYYRVAQQACEDMGNALAKELGISFIWPKLTNVYGVGEDSPRLINTMIRTLLKNENYPTSPGEQLYDFIYIDDAVNIYIELAKNHQLSNPVIIGSGKPQKLKDYLKIVEQEVAGTGKTEFGKFDYTGMYYLDRELNATRLLKEIDYEIKNDFKSGVDKTISWIRNEEC